MSNPEKILHEALVHLAAELMATARQDEHGTYWETLHRQPYGPLYHQVNEELYNGVAGIALFFADLFNYTQDPRYLEVARSSTQWVLHYANTHPPRYFTFYSGFTGVIFLHLRMFEISGDQACLQQAVQLTAQLQEGIENKVVLDDLLSGHAGNLLVITLLYKYTGEEAHFKLLGTILDKLISRARVSRYGIKWGYKNNALDSFTGMSHGASGIAHVLMEVAAALDSPELQWLADKAFAFTDQYYSRALGTWVDMRIFPAHKTGYANKNLNAYFAHRPDINTWAHGISGIGLARLNAYRLCREKKYSRTAMHAINATQAAINKETLHTNYTLGTGYGSWIELLLTGAIVLNKPALKAAAMELALKAVETRNSNGYYASAWYLNHPDPALMMGMAGIGHWLLRLLDPGKTRSMLLPGIPDTIPSRTERKLYLSDIKQRIYGQHFKRTIGLLEYLGCDLSSLYPPNRHKTELQEYWQGLAQQLHLLPENERAVAREIFHYELSMVKMWINPGINLYRELRTDAFKAQAQAMQQWQEADFHRYTYRISQHCAVFMHQWQWSLNNKAGYLHNSSAAPGAYPVIVRMELEAIAEFSMNTFSYLLLEALKKKQSFNTLLTHFMKVYGINDRNMLGDKIKEQLKYLSAQWFIETFRRT